MMDNKEKRIKTFFAVYNVYYDNGNLYTLVKSSDGSINGYYKDHLKTGFRNITEALEWYLNNYKSRFELNKAKSIVEMWSYIE